MLDSDANRIIIPLVDYLELGEEARFNTPSTLGGNWTYRLDKNQINEKLIQKIKNLKK